MGRERKISQYFKLFLLILIIYTVTYWMGFEDNTKFIQIIMMGGILASVFLYIYQKDDDLITLAITLGFIMRIGYMLYTPSILRGHDIGDMSLNGTGHAGYILNLYFNHRLPDSNEYQLYHPPFYHILSAGIISFLQIFFHETDLVKILDGAKAISCFASCAVLFVIRSICEELRLGKDATKVTMLIMAFFPNFYLLAGRVNNDSLVILFMMLTILYTYRWFHKRTYRNLIGMALSIGLGMMTKTSCGILAFFTGSIMIYVLIQWIREKQYKKILLQYRLFVAVCFPLGLWYPIRNYLLFHQPLNYVWPLGMDSPLYCGNYSVFQRLVAIPWSKLFLPVYAQPFEDYNVILYTAKCSVFGEFGYDIISAVPKMLLGFNVILILMSVGAMVYLICYDDSTRKEIRYGLGAIWGIFWSTYLFFNIKYPFGCSMDYRYIVPTAVMGAMFLGIVYEKMNEKENWKKAVFQNGLMVTIFGFAIWSILMYCNIAV